MAGIAPANNRKKVLHPIVSSKIMLINRHLVSPVGKAPFCCAGGLGFDSRPDHHSGS